KLLELIWRESSNEEIARVMCISLSAVEKLKNHLKKKTDAKTSVGLIRYALERRIIVIPDR
ncbi:MAG: DNA-binding response regulator, partial [Flavihumibacter sp.]